MTPDTVAAAAHQVPPRAASRSPRRIVVTGIGTVSGFGLGADALWSGIAEGRCALRPIAQMPSGEVDRLGGEVSGYNEAEHFTRSSGMMLDRVSQIAVVSARLAASDAGLDRDAFAALGRRVGVIYGASPGQATLDAGYLALYGNHAKRLHPFTVPRILPAGPSAAISIEFGAKGPCFGTASACATSTHSIGLGFDMIRAGRLEMCVCGGSDASIVYGYVRAWEALRLLANDTVRPFSRDRTGIVLGEGAATLILEEYEHARARGAPILAEILGFGMTADAVDMVAPDAESAAAAMQDAIEDAGLTSADIGYVNAHGTGTRMNDRTEVEALKQVFGGKVPPTSSLKSQLGHTLNAAGGMETAATALALRHQILPPTLNFREPDPECDIDCVPNTPRAGRFDYAMMNSLGFGGLNAVLVVGRG
jgi:nodulation protein E